MAGGINLSSRPFVNARPVVRATVLLWLVGSLLLIWAGSRFLGYYAGRADQRQEIARIEAQMAEERRTIVSLQSRLAVLAPQDQNDRVAFLNRRIAERTFSWSLLFDRLAGILPADVRLQSLAPQFSFDASSSPRGSRALDSEDLGSNTRVRLNIQGAAKSSESILVFIDALFADPAFERPNPHQEALQGRESEFSLSVDYLPAVASPPVGVEVEPEPEPELEPELVAAADPVGGEA